MKRIVADSMVLIHLAKITLLESLCQCCEVKIPKEVYQETAVGEFPDAVICKNLAGKNKIKVMEASTKIVNELEKFSIVKGEAEAVALFKEGKADIIATDDNVVRKNSAVLDLKLIGTPALIKWMFRERKIPRDKALKSLSELKKIGWFEAGMIDRIIVEVEKYG